MPPEPFPWDRRDFRKHQRSELDPCFGMGYGGTGHPRWRDQHHPYPPPYHHHQQQQRWNSDFRVRPFPPGHGKQTGWHMHRDEAGYGFPPNWSQLNDRNIGEEIYRPYGSCSNRGRHFRNTRESRGSCSQKYLRAATSREPVLSPGVHGRNAETIDQSLIENTQAGHNNYGANNSCESNYSFHTPNSVNTSQLPQSTLEELQSKGVGNAERLTSAVKMEKENYLGSINWKPLKWSRSVNLSSRGSSLGQSSSSKSMSVDSIETVTVVQEKKVTLLQSHTSGDIATVIADTPFPSEGANSSKKPRLGWGEGLAKYEKKKVDGPEDDAIKSSLTITVSNIEETVQSHSVNQLDESPIGAGFASPATPSSITFSSSPGTEKKQIFKPAVMDQDASNLSCSPRIDSPAHYELPAFHLENLELSTLNSSSLVSEFLQLNNPCSGNAYHVDVNKVLSWKACIYKELERTVSEIDSLETKLKLLISEPINSPLPDPSISQLQAFRSKPFEEQETSSNSTFKIPLLKIVPDGNENVDNEPVIVDDEHVRLIAKNINGLDCEASICVEVSPVLEDSYPSQASTFLVNLDDNNSTNSDGNYLDNYLCNVGNTDYAGYDELNAIKSYQDPTSFSDAHYDIPDAYGSILASNKDLAKGASEALDKLLPAKQRPYDIMTKSGVSCLQSDSLVIRKNFLVMKRYIRFKEKALTIKYKLFQHFWIRGMIVSLRKLRAISHNELDLIAHKRHRCSRARIYSSAGNSRIVSAEAVIEVVRECLSKSLFKPNRIILKMPALALDDKELQISRFISNNGAVEDPYAFEKERSMINSWTVEEKEIFLDKLVMLGKNFRKIASFLDHKTTADCVEFYYKNHKSDFFKKAKKNPGIVKKRKSHFTTYLVASGKRWSREASADSLGMLGAASAIVATVNSGIVFQQKSMPKILSGVSSSYKASRYQSGPFRRSNSLDLDSNEKEAVAADVLAGICGSLSSEAMSSCITSSVDHGDGYHDWRRQKIGQKIGFCSKPPFTPEVTQSVDECSDESCGELDPSDWSDEEKSIFMQALSSYGKDFVMISQCVRTRSRDQCKVFFSKARKCLRLDLIQPGLGIAVPGDVNGGDSDIEDASGLENGSVICSEDMMLSHDADIIKGVHHLKPDPEGHVANNSLQMDIKPVLKNLWVDNRQGEEKHILDVNVNINGWNGVDSSVQEFGTMAASSNAETILRIELPDDCGLPNGPTEAEGMAFFEVSDGRLGKENQESEIFSSSKDVGRRNVSDSNCAVSVKSELKLAGNTSHPAFHSHSAVKVDSVSGCKKRTDFKLSTTEKSCAVSLQQNDIIASLRSSTLFSVPIKYQKLSFHNSLSPVDFNVADSKHSQKVAATGDCQMHLCGHPLSDLVESSRFMNGYPVSVPTVSKEMDSCLSHKIPVPLQNTFCSDGTSNSVHCRYLALRKCENPRDHCEVVEATCPSQKQSIDQSRPEPCCSSNVSKPSMTSDVKLFGKILASSQQKPNSCGQLNDNSSQNHKSGCLSANMKFSGGKKVKLHSAVSKFDCNSVGLENIPVTNVGFWDVNRVQAGLPPMLDSGILSAKNGTAFSNYAKSAAKVEQPAFLGVVKSNGYTIISSVSISPSRELCCRNGVTGYTKNQELQPFTIDVKNPHDVFFSEMQKLNVVSGTQQQSRGIVGRGALFGAGVLDPAAAVKVDYAKTNGHGLQTGNISTSPTRTTNREAKAT